MNFDVEKFNALFERRKSILEGNNEEEKKELFNQVNNLFDYLSYPENSIPDLLNKLSTYFNENIARYKSAISDPSSVQISNEESLLMGRMNNAYEEALRSTSRNNVSENVQSNDDVRTNTYYHSPRVKKPKKNNITNHGLSMIAIIFEILTVALVVMMFLSLDI